MYQALIIGGNKDFNVTLSKTLKLLDFNTNKENCNLKNISKYYDYVIINDAKRKLKGEINCRYCFINMDTAKNSSLHINGSTITYGFGSKNTLTISSLDDVYEGFVYCLQRFIKVNEKLSLEPQEIPVSICYKNEEELYAMLVCISIRMIQGVGSEGIEDKLNNIK